MKTVAEMDFPAGEVLLIDKPKSWSSFDLVKKVRSLVRIKKVGHAGTLDPLATGLMIVCTGKKTKKITAIQDSYKEYEVEFYLGATTKSYDSEFPPENLVDAIHIDRTEIEAVLPQFLGAIEQLPPAFSAVKVNGRRAYKSARAGREVQVRPRMVMVKSFELLDFEGSEKVTARIVCTKGTYIRSLVHDLGQLLGVGGYILELKRTKIGDHLLENAWDIDEFTRQMSELRKSQREATT